MSSELQEESYYQNDFMVDEDQDFRTFDTSSPSFTLFKDNQINQYTNSTTAINQQLELVVSDKNEEKVKRNQEQLQTVGITTQQIVQDSKINFSSEFILTNDGALRFLPCQNWLSFGFQDQKVEIVKELKDIGVVQVSFQKSAYFNYLKFDQALQLIKKIPSIQYEAAHQLFINFYSMGETLNNLIHITNEQIFIQREYEFQQFRRFSQKFLKQYSEQQTNKLYSYSIGKVNLQSKEMETVEVGYSQEYLNLLGLTYDNLTHLALRNQKIDLLQSIQDVTYQSMIGVQQMSNCRCGDQSEYYESDIVTFDGFPIKIYQQKILHCELYKHQQTQGLDSEFFISTTEIDVDLKSLENLIEYRKRIYQKSKNLNIDDFLRKELSYKFEDVEYSVHSQSFVDKFYTENVKRLKKLQEMKEFSHLVCKYKYIDNDEKKEQLV